MGEDLPFKRTNHTSKIFSLHQQVERDDVTLHPHPLKFHFLSKGRASLFIMMRLSEEITVESFQKRIFQIRRIFASLGMLTFSDKLLGS